MSHAAVCMGEGAGGMQIKRGGAQALLSRPGTGSSSHLVSSPKGMGEELTSRVCWHHPSVPSMASGLGLAGEHFEDKRTMSEATAAGPAPVVWT